MFDKLLKELKKLEHGVKIPVKLPLDDEGYLDRECHAETCRAEFKVLFQDWGEKSAPRKCIAPFVGMKPLRASGIQTSNTNT